MKDRFHISKKDLIKGDVLNTLNGGMSLPQVEFGRREDHYQVDVKMAGVSPASLKVDVEGQRLVISHLVRVEEGSSEGTPLKAPNILQILPIPYDVDLEGIRAHYDDRGLHVVLPQNAYAQGFRKNVGIERK